MATDNGYQCRGANEDTRKLFDTVLADVTITFITMWYLLYLYLGHGGEAPPDRTDRRPARRAGGYGPSNMYHHQGQPSHSSGNNSNATVTANAYTVDRVAPAR